MIVGLRVQIPSNTLKALCTRYAEFCAAEAERLSDEAEQMYKQYQEDPEEFEDGEDDDEFGDGAGGVLNEVQELRIRAKGLRASRTFYAYLADFLVPHETYDLDIDELRALGIELKVPVTEDLLAQSPEVDQA